MIELKNLTKKFGNKTVLNNINLKFEKGKVYGIVGENGAGKTTLFRCISELEKYEGEIISDLQPLKNYTGLLLTNPYFFSRITGREYLQLLCNARQVEIRDFEKQNIFDLPLNQYASTYSTGMKKKLAIMAILLQENQVFILDEPYNGVDIQSNLIITELILELKRLNKTVIISSHIFSTLNETCDEIHLLKTGELIKTVQKEEFKELEEEMKRISIGDKLKAIQLK
ncbi:MAG: ATP-binding cassette domain-containing protein [Brumimicrobium sp.]|nr:ATP-binding cassette domain-containing protein [Brumimicrobium sp.]